MGMSLNHCEESLKYSSIFVVKLVDLHSISYVDYGGIVIFARKFVKNTQIIS